MLVVEDEAVVEPSCVEGSSDEYEDVVGGGVVALSLSSRVLLRLLLPLALLDEAVEAVAKAAVTLLLLKAAFPASPV